MISGNPFKEFKSFCPEDLHGKVGKMVYIKPTDLDIQEGNFMAQLVFMTEDAGVYILDERDVRSES